MADVLRAIVASARRSAEERARRTPLASLASGEFTVADTIGTLDDGTPLRLAHRWPVRTARR